MVLKDERREQETKTNFLPQYLMCPISSLTAEDAKDILTKRPRLEFIMTIIYATYASESGADSLAATRPRQWPCTTRYPQNF